MHDTAVARKQLPRRTLSRIVACTLTGEDLAAQASRWRKLHERAGVARSEVEDGVRLTFRDDDGVEEELRSLVAAENECCAWAAWSVARGDGVLVMHARSHGNGIAALHGMLHMPD